MLLIAPTAVLEQYEAVEMSTYPLGSGSSGFCIDLSPAVTLRRRLEPVPHRVRRNSGLNTTCSVDLSFLLFRFILLVNSLAKSGFFGNNCCGESWMVLETWPAGSMGYLYLFHLDTDYLCIA